MRQYDAYRQLAMGVFAVIGLFTYCSGSMSPELSQSHRQYLYVNCSRRRNLRSIVLIYRLMTVMSQEKLDLVGSVATADTTQQAPCQPSVLLTVYCRPTCQLFSGYIRQSMTIKIMLIGFFNRTAVPRTPLCPCLPHRSFVVSLLRHLI